VKNSTPLKCLSCSTLGQQVTLRFEYKAIEWRDVTQRGGWGGLRVAHPTGFDPWENAQNDATDDQGSEGRPYPLSEKRTDIGARRNRVSSFTKTACLPIGLNQIVPSGGCFDIGELQFILQLSTREKKTSPPNCDSSCSKKKETLHVLEKGCGTKTT